MPDHLQKNFPNFGNFLNHAPPCEQQRWLFDDWNRNFWKSFSALLIFIQNVFQKIDGFRWLDLSPSNRDSSSRERFREKERERETHWRVREKEIDSNQCQCDQIGRFLKVIGNQFAYKSIPKFGLFIKRSINVKTAVNIFRQLVETFGQLFYPNIWSHWLRRRTLTKS